MHLVCLDLEGVLVPEIWISFAEATGIDELKLTTRDVPDYDVLMKGRLSILKEHHLTLADIQQVIGKMKPLQGAREFLTELRSMTRVIILSDTFVEFAGPLMEKLDNPMLFCNSLEVGEAGAVDGYTLRIRDGKRRSVEALMSAGFKVIAAGDSYNDVSMLRAADFGVFFRPPRTIAEEYPQFPATDTHAELLEAISTAFNTLS